MCVVHVYTTSTQYVALTNVFIKIGRCIEVGFGTNLLCEWRGITQFSDHLVMEILNISERHLTNKQASVLLSKQRQHKIAFDLCVVKLPEFALVFH